MQNIQISIAERRPQVLGSPVLVCNNVGDTITFTFDDEWTEGTKTARFVYESGGSVHHQDVEFSGDTVEIPPLSNTRSVRVGVYAGALTTTTAAYIPCELSILCGSGTEAESLFDMGRQAERSAFWAAYQQEGARGNYSQGFAGEGWTSETFKPEYDIKATNAYMLFAGCLIEGDLVAILEEQGVTLDTSKASLTSYMFQGATKLTHIGVIDLTSSTNSVAADTLCTNCTSLVTFDKIVVKDSTKFAASSFRNCSALQYVGFEGTLGQSLNLQFSPLLTQACLQDIIDHLGTVTTQQTLTLHSDVAARLTPDQHAAIEAKNWTIA